MLHPLRVAQGQGARKVKRSFTAEHAGGAEMYGAHARSALHSEISAVFAVKAVLKMIKAGGLRLHVRIPVLL
jgi:hypothetical protein